MDNKIFILSVYDAWTGSDRLRPIGATTDETMLNAMIAAKIKDGDITYGNDMAKSWRNFLHDFKAGKVDYTKLGRGEVQSYGNMQITELISMEAFPEATKAYEEITGAKAKLELETLGLDKRSLTYSMVEVRTDYGYADFLMPGICDRDSLESNEHYQELMDGSDDTEVCVSVSAYSVGTGESEYPDESDLAIIEKYSDELDAEHGVDCIQTDFFSFPYDAEQEY